MRRMETIVVTSILVIMILASVGFATIPVTVTCKNFNKASSCLDAGCVWITSLKKCVDYKDVLLPKKPSTTSLSTSTTSPPKLYAIEVQTKVSVIDKPVANVKLFIDDRPYYTNSKGKVIVYPSREVGRHSVIMDASGTTFEGRKVSYIVDHDKNNDCIQNDSIYKDFSGVYTFFVEKPHEKTHLCKKTLTIYYRAKTKIVDLKYQNGVISGKLLMENDKPIPSRLNDNHRKVKLYYSTNGGKSWNYLATVTASSSDGSFSYNWKWNMQILPYRDKEMVRSGSQNRVGPDIVRIPEIPLQVKAVYQDDGKPSWYFMSSSAKISTMIPIPPSKPAPPSRKTTMPSHKHRYYGPIVSRGRYGGWGFIRGGIFDQLKQVFANIFQRTSGAFAKILGVNR